MTNSKVMGCKFSKKSSGRVGVIETFKSAHYQPLISSKITRKLRTRKKGSRKLEYSSNIKFSDFSTTSATYVKSASETSKITVRLSCDGSTLEIEQCDTTHEIVDDLSEIKVFNESVVRSVSVPILSSSTHFSVKRSKFESMGLNNMVAQHQRHTMDSAWFNEKYNFENIDKTRCPLACQISDELFPKCDTCTDAPGIATTISGDRVCNDLTSVDIHTVPETNFHSNLPLTSPDEREISDGNVILFSSELHGDYSRVLCQDDSRKFNSDITSMIGGAENKMARFVKRSEDGVNETHFTDIRKPQCSQGQYLTNSSYQRTYKLPSQTRDTHNINTCKDEVWFNLLSTEGYNNPNNNCSETSETNTLPCRRIQKQESMLNHNISASGCRGIISPGENMASELTYSKLQISTGLNEQTNMIDDGMAINNPPDPRVSRSNLYDKLTFHQAMSSRTKNPTLTSLAQQFSDTTLTNFQKIGESESTSVSSHFTRDNSCNQESRTVNEHDITPNQLLRATDINQQDIKTLDLNFGTDITFNQLTSTRSNNSDLGSLDCVNSHVVDTRMDDTEHNSNSQTARFLFTTSNHAIEISPHGDFPAVSNNQLSCIYDDGETESKNQLLDDKLIFVETELDTDIYFESRLVNGNLNDTDKSDSILNDPHNSSDCLYSEHFQDENPNNSSGINRRKASFNTDNENHESSNNDNLHYSYSIKSYRDSAEFAPINNLIQTEFRTKELIDDIGNCDTVLCQRTCPHMTYLEQDSGFSDSFL